MLGRGVTGGVQGGPSAISRGPTICTIIHFYRGSWAYCTPSTHTLWHSHILYYDIILYSTNDYTWTFREFQEFQGDSGRFRNFWTNFRKFQGVLSIFREIQELLKEFQGDSVLKKFQGVWRCFREFQGVLRGSRHFLGDSGTFKGFQWVSSLLNFKILEGFSKIGTNVSCTLFQLPPPPSQIWH